MRNFRERRPAPAAYAFTGISAIAFIIMSLHASAALAQDAPPTMAGMGSPDIVVTARKRSETALTAPVILDVLTPQKLERLNITNVYGLNSVVPSLTIVQGSFVGVIASLRGLGNGSSANFADQTVAMNLDGLTAPSGAFYRAGAFDLGQLEVLKGPQALFFGKSTSGGVIALHTADPTTAWDSKISASYETVADEAQYEGFISGPVTDSLGFRLAGTLSRSEGYLINRNPTVKERRKQGVDTEGVRATLLYDPGAGLRIRAKAFYARNENDADQASLGITICPTRLSPYLVTRDFDDCRLNRTVAGLPDSLPYRPGSYGPTDFANFAVGSPDRRSRDGSPYSRVTMFGIPLQVDVDIADGLSFTSLSGYQTSHFTSSTAYSNGPTLFNFIADDKIKEFSQEVRLTSDWKESWINFMVGGLYSDTKRDAEFLFVAPAGAYFSRDNLQLKTKQSSAFAQVTLTPIEKLELSVGGRYTRVHRYFSQLINFANFLPAPVDNLGNVSKGNRDRTENNFSPEITLSYRPTSDLTIFGSYKTGYKAHSFNANLTAVTFNDREILPYDGERVKGFEGGLKGKLFDNSLAFTLTGYRYNYDNLQVSFSDQATASVIVSNGANARIQGVEFTADYSPPALPGLVLTLAGNYNDAYYRAFPRSPCYGNQSVAQGCSQPPGSPDRFQDQAGNQLAYAPKWTGIAGLDYGADLGQGLVGGFNLRAAFTGGTQASPEYNPLGYQKRYTLFDAGIRLGRANEAWTLSLLCRNCTNKYYIGDTSDTGVITDPGSPSPVEARLARPRQVVLRLTVRPGQW